MSKTMKIFIIVMAVILIPIYLFYGLGFGLQLMGFIEAANKEGFRAALTSPESSDLEFYASVTWLALMIISIYIIPLILILAAIIYFLRRKRKTR